MDKEVKILKPMTMSEILDDTFKIFGRNFRAILIFSALISGVYSLITLFLTDKMMVPMNSFLEDWMKMIQTQNPDPEALLGSMADLTPRLFALQGVIFALSLFGTIFINPVVQGGIINITYNNLREQVLDGHRALVSTLKKFWKLVLTNLSLLLYYIGVGIAFIIILGLLAIPTVMTGMSMSQDPTGGKIAIFIFIVFALIVITIILAILSYIFILFTMQVTVTEDRYGFGAIGRSFKLVAGKFWRVLGINLLIGIIVAIVYGITIFVSGISTLISPGGSFITRYIMTLIQAALIMPISYISTTLLFMDTKARLEPYGRVSQEVIIEDDGEI